MQRRSGSRERPTWRRGKSACRQFQINIRRQPGYLCAALYSDGPRGLFAAAPGPVRWIALALKIASRSFRRPGCTQFAEQFLCYILQPLRMGLRKLARQRPGHKICLMEMLQN